MELLEAIYSLRAMMIASVIALSLVACTGGKDGVIESLSDNERADITAEITPIEEAVGFSVLFPDFLPEGIDPVPLASADPDGNVASLVFEPEPGSDLDKIPFILLNEHAGSARSETCDTRSVVRTDPGASCADVRHGDLSIVSELAWIGMDRIDHMATTVIDGRKFVVFVDWQADPSEDESATLTDEKQEVAFNILESLLPLNDAD